MINRILTPREILIGGGSRHRLAELLLAHGVKRPLIVADPAMVRIGHADELIDSLRRAGLAPALCGEVVEDPTDTSVQSVVVMIRDNDHDAIVALGGGSAMDTAKAAAISVAEVEGDLSALKVPRLVDFPVMPVVAMPTTAGTGSEVTRAAVITNTQTQEKMLIVGTAAMPLAAIVDYELTLTCPFRVTVDTGIDALTHALEAIVNRNANPHSDALAVSALQLIGGHLDLAAREPSNLKAREAMMLGATHAGLAVSGTSTALVHGMSRPLGAFFHVPHGMSNAMVLPLVTDFSLDMAQARYAMAARALGVTRADDDGEAARSLVGAFADMNRRLEVPTLRGFGIDEDRFHSLIPEMARQGLASGTPANNPRVPDQGEMEDLYERAWRDQLYQ